MAELIGSIGAGLFALLIIAGFALVIAIALSYMLPDATFFILLGCACIPVIAFAFIMSAPYEPKVHNYNTPVTTASPGSTVVPSLSASYFYPNDGSPDDLSDLIDKWLPVRVTMMVVVCLGVVSGAVYLIVLALTAPPYVAPQVQCLRRQLEQMHPSWYK